MLVNDELTYSSQIYKSLAKTRQKIGWISRTFRSRENKFLRILWNSLVQPHMDYMSILISLACTEAQIIAQESPLRNIPRWLGDVRK